MSPTQDEVLYAESSPILEVKNLVVEFGAPKRKKLKAVDGLNLKVNRNVSVGIVGESGSGKSVTALSILQLLGPLGKIAGGDILYKGKSLLDLNKNDMREIRGKEISMIFQEPMASLNPVFTIKQQISAIIRTHKQMSEQDAAEEALNMLASVGLRNPKEVIRMYPHELSGGMAQRVMIAMALVCRPNLLIADEPTTALDVTTQALILNLLKELIDKFNLTLVLITHDIGIAAKVCEKLGVMYLGEIVEYGDVWDVIERPKHPYTQGLIKAIPNFEQEEEPQPIRGTVPSLSEVPMGCRFNTRCPYVMEICRSKSPEPRRLSGDRYVSCHLYSTEVPGK